MMISCFAKAHYLNKHMKNLSVSDGSLSSPRLHSQIRVTVTGILQELLCFLCAMWIIVDVMSVYLSSYFFFDHYITFTVINLYILGSTVNLGWVESDVAAIISYTIVLLLMHVNMTSYVWLMFYYHIMIVPSQRVLFLWVKKNIKSVIYVVMLLDSLIFLFNNGTEFVFIDIGIALVSIVYIYLFLCLFVMMISCFATAHYLNKHMKSISVSDGSLSSPRLHSQIRVTVTGILQGVLCFLCTICDLVDVMSFYLSPYFEFDVYILLTVINLYIFGTTINLAVGQTLFRERVPDMHALLNGIFPNSFSYWFNRQDVGLD
uniref:Taste receptor type 2 n=1 Tax=Gadus morhua TaxID=8049 RepID=A0A8C5CZQ4_GADMO